MLKNSLAGFAALLWTLTGPFAHAAGYHVVDRIKVADGAFDYATFDPSSGKVFMPRGTFTTVIDTRTNVVSKLSNGVSDHIALPLPGTSELVLTQRKGVIRILDGKTDTVVTDLPGGENPNSAVYDPRTQTAIVLNKGSGSATLIDPKTRMVQATIPIAGGVLEFPVVDRRGRLYDNIETTAEIAVIDLPTRKEVGRFSLKGCEGPSGLAYDQDADLLVSACSNGIAKVVRATDGVEVASLAIGRGPDAVIFDPKRKLAFVPCGADGVLDVISLQDVKRISVVQQLATQQGSRTGTVDPGTGRLYLMASKPDTTASVPPGGRVPRLAGSWEVLVIAP